MNIEEEWLKYISFNLSLWIENVNNKKINDCILMVDISLQKSIEESIKNKDNYISYNFNTMKSTAFSSNRNLILFYSDFFQQEELNHLNKKILYLYKSINFDTIKKHENYRNEYIDEKLLKYVYIQRIEPYELISNILDKDFLFKVISNYHNFFSNFFSNYNRRLIYNIKYNDIELKLFSTISDELNLLHKNKLLTSRLAVIIYRLTNLNVEASTTKIGTYFAKCIGSKSQVLNYIRDKDKLFAMRESFFKTKDIRVYDLNKNDLEEKIQLRIANNLINLERNEKLNLETIAKVTNLSINVIKKLEEKALLNQIKLN